MKTYEEIIKQTPIYLNNWKEKIDVLSDFGGMFMTGEEYRLEESPYPNVEMFIEAKRKMKKNN